MVTKATVDTASLGLESQFCHCSLVINRSDNLPKKEKKVWGPQRGNQSIRDGLPPPRVRSHRRVCPLGDANDPMVRGEGRGGLKEPGVAVVAAVISGPMGNHSTQSYQAGEVPGIKIIITLH